MQEPKKWSFFVTSTSTFLRAKENVSRIKNKRRLGRSKKKETLFGRFLVLQNEKRIDKSYSNEIVLTKTGLSREEKKQRKEKGGEKGGSRLLF